VFKLRPPPTLPAGATMNQALPYTRRSIPSESLFACKAALRWARKNPGFPERPSGYLVVSLPVSGSGSSRHGAPALTFGHTVADVVLALSEAGTIRHRYDGALRDTTWHSTKAAGLIRYSTLRRRESRQIDYARLGRYPEQAHNHRAQLIDACIIRRPACLLW
jgi:hypothetical protein